MVASPFISYVTVCFNSEKTIEDTIKSVLEQSDDDFEYIIIDGKSSDKTLNIIQDYQKLYPDKITYISEKDNGIYDAMNKGIKLAKGKLLCMINSDDWLEKDAVKKIKRFYSGNSYEVVYGMQRTISNDIEENCIFYNHNFLTKRMICHQAAYVTKECFERYGVFSLDYKSVSDYDFMLRLFTSQNVQFTPVHEILVNFRSGGMSNSYTAIKETAELKYKYGIISKKSMYIGMFKAWLVKNGVLSS